MYVLKCLSEGQRKQDIVDTVVDDERRVSVWIEFAKSTHLLDQNHSGKWLISDKGRLWIKDYHPNYDSANLKAVTVHANGGEQTHDLPRSVFSVRYR